MNQTQTQPIPTSPRRAGKELVLGYLLPRCRKPKRAYFHATTKEETLELAKKFKVDNKAKFTGGYVYPTTCYDVESDGKIITMVSTAIFAVGELLVEEELNELNK